LRVDTKPALEAILLGNFPARLFPACSIFSFTLDLSLVKEKTCADAKVHKAECCNGPPAGLRRHNEIIRHDPILHTTFLGTQELTSGQRQFEGKVLAPQAVHRSEHAKAPVFLVAGERSIAV